MLLSFKFLTRIKVTFGEGNGNPFQYSCLGNPIDRKAWQATVHEVTKSWTRLKTTTNLLYAPQLQYYDFPRGSDGKASAYNVGDPGSISGLGRSFGGRSGNPLQYSCPENPMDGGAW